MQSVYAERFIRAALGLTFAALLLRLLITLPPMGPFPPEISLHTQRPVAQMIAQALPLTLKAVATGIGLGLPLALLLGIPAGLRPGSLLDRLLQGPAVALAGVPAFVIALQAVWFLAVKGRLASLTATGQVTLALLYGAWMARSIRSGLAAARTDGAHLSVGRAVVGSVGRILQQSGNLLVIAGLVSKIGPWGEALWRLATQGALTRDYPVVYGALQTLLLLTIAGHLAGDLLVAAAGAPGAGAPDQNGRTGPRISRSWLITGLAFFAVLLLFSLLPTGDPTAINLKERLLPPGPGHLFGTDQYGRDLLRQMAYGARNSLLVAAAAALVATVAGAILAGLGRVTGRWGMAILSPRIGIPSLSAPLVAGLAASLLLKPGAAVLIFSLGLASIPAMATAWRQVFEPIGATGVTARTVASAGGLALLAFAQILLAEVTLSFSALGLQPPTASIGSLIMESVTYIARSPSLLWAAVPGSLGLAGLFLAGHALAGEEA